MRPNNGIWPNTWIEIQLDLSLWRPACQTLSKTLDISSATDHIAPSLLKALAIILNTIVRKAVVDREDLKLYWKSEKRPTVLYMTNAPIIYKFFKDFTNHRKKSSRVVVFSCRLPKNS